MQLDVGDVSTRPLILQLSIEKITDNLKYVFKVERYAFVSTITENH